VIATLIGKLENQQQQQQQLPTSVVIIIVTIDWTQPTT
jgi:hypothetical protein